MNYKILVVDDEPANTRMLERIFRDTYEVITAQSGEEGLESLNIHDIALIISDQRMPGMTGVEFLKRSAEVRPNCVRIILTGYTDAADLVEALNSGVVYKYVTKPWVNSDLLLTVKRGLAHHETIKAQHLLHLENMRLHGRVTSLEDGIIKLSAELLAFKNEEWSERAVRIRHLAGLLGKTLNLDNSSLVTLGQAAYLHGIADVFVPNGLLMRRRELTQNEQIFVNSSRERGLELLAELTEAKEIMLALKHQYEHYDGTGSPDGLAGIQIPLCSRIIAIVTEFDNLILPSSGSPGIADDEALSELHRQAGRKFDPRIVKAFCSSMALDPMQKMYATESSAVYA